MRSSTLFYQGYKTGNTLNYSASAKDAKKSLKFNSENKVALNILLLSYSLVDNHEKMMKANKKYGSDISIDGILHNTLCITNTQYGIYLLAKQTKEDSLEAKIMFNKAVNHGYQALELLDYNWININIGLAFHHLGERDSAYYRTELANEYIAYLNNTGVFYAIDDNNIEAASMFKKAIEIDDTYLCPKRNLEKLNSTYSPIFGTGSNPSIKEEKWWFTHYFTFNVPLKYNWTPSPQIYIFPPQAYGPQYEWQLFTHPQENISRDKNCH